MLRVGLAFKLQRLVDLGYMPGGRVALLLVEGVGLVCFVFSGRGWIDPSLFFLASAQYGMREPLELPESKKPPVA